MDRPHYIHEIQRFFRTHQVVALLGPRQFGKTTLVRMDSSSQKDFESVNYFDFLDSGILHSLLNIHTIDDLRVNPKIGASWEGFALEEVIRIHGVRNQDCYFWST